MKYLATRVVGMAADTIALGFAYLLAFILRFDFQEPKWGWRAVALSFVTVCAVHLVCLLVTGCYRLAWRRICLKHLPRYVLATTLASIVLTAARYFLPDLAFAHIRPPYSITVISFFLATIGLVAVRYLWRLAWSATTHEETLLDRDLRRFDNATAARFLSGRTVLVTGAGGTIGSEIVRQVAAAGAKCVLMVERGENALYEIDRHMRGTKCAAVCVPLMIDCGEAERMMRIFENEKPSVVLHAAAYKHVPMVEANPDEGWRNNLGATKTMAELAKRYGVERFVMISTDKAVNPVSVMGKTKLAAEQAVMALNESDRSDKAVGDEVKSSFCAVRFGNVFGSSGSVVPLFRELISKRQPLPVTHPDMKRYFMTVGEAVNLVLQAASRKEGAIYTLDMGEPVRIVDLAEGMIAQAGYRPYVDIPIVFTGVRPGEKLFEELDVSERSCYKTDMAKIYITK